MELQIVLVGAVVFIVSAVIIYLISAFTMKEKTFEEVIAEQRRKQEEEELKIKQEKKAEKDTRRRKKGKEKVKGDQSPKVSMPSVPVVKPEEPKFTEHKMVNIELEPEIIEPVAAEVPLKKTKKLDKPAKPILHNKDEKTYKVAEENMEEYVHRGPPPKDDMELKLIRDKKEKQKKERSKKQEEPEPVVEEMMQMSQTSSQAAAPSAKTGTGHAQLITSLKEASFSENEAQTMIDILLSKQGGATPVASDWNKKSQRGDPVVMLRKQLEEKEKALQEEQQMVFAANNKYKEINQQLTQEKLKAQTTEKQLIEKIDYQGRETVALHQRMQHAHEQHMQETKQFQTRIQQLEAQTGDKSQYQKVIEENKSLREALTKTQSESLPAAEANSLKQKVSIMEKEMSSNMLKLNSSENTCTTLKKKVEKLEAEIKRLESQSSTGSVLEKRIDELSQELRSLESKNKSLEGERVSREQAVDMAQKECVNLKIKLQELERALTESDNSTREREERLKRVSESEAERLKINTEENLKNLQKKIESIDNEKTSLKTEVQSLKQENSQLSTELKTTQEKVQETQAKSSQMNGDVRESENTISMEDHHKQLSDKDAQLTKLTTEMQTTISKVAELESQLETQKQKNNDALSSNQREVESYDKTLLQRLFPEVTVASKASHKEWMTEFEQQISAHNKALKQSSSASSDNSAKLEVRVSELESHIEELKTRQAEAESSRDKLQSALEESDSASAKLQLQVGQYRNVLSETENKLTQLENSVEAEEKKWQERLAAKEEELTQLKNEHASAKSSGSDSQEMKDRLLDLESQFRTSQDQCSLLQSQLKQAESRTTEYTVHITELQKTSTAVTEVNAELEKLKVSLAGEQKKNKDLASQIVRLNGIIKTGHDALTQEQNLVKKLKEQMSNGVDKQGSGDIPASSEVDKLRAQLEEKDRLLEKEISAKKLLSQKLAQLGVMTASHTSLNDEGTSV
ncbi:ribosome-binding protein 1-like isoform X6 [Dreissena polymorpha]|uniref:ribosome-binding protein 1-like isoform X6 n=1 Tax=Dreissena polymorpha TaxID=45954 RepID=UPI002264DF43|nr:ribosome-binding protein 1-like isoform X6 [Dreissena polymorpha]